MDCPKCNTGNPAAAKFCISCGSPLALACPKCQTELPSGAQFCFSCGQRIGEPAPVQQAEPVAKEAQDLIHQYIPPELLAKLESARTGGGMQGERRVVTMLFCDVQGSTAAAEQLDPEEWAEIMNGAFEHLIEPVYRYEGTLARLMGDAILAFFGAPIAHEDDPQRAVMAGLDILQAIDPYRDQVMRDWRLDFNVRVGINTGLVVVGEVGSDLRVEYTALGDAVNLASRMEQTADPGTVRITENTYRHIEPLFHFEDLGGIEVKGKSKPVQAYRALGAREDPGSLRGIEGLDAPLIGREHEMSSLRGAVAGLRQGNGGIFCVMGEAGLGKSRLIAELRQSLVADGLLPEPGAQSVNGSYEAATATLGWFEGRSLSYQTSTSYAPFVALFNAIFDLRTDQTDEQKYEILPTVIDEVMPDGAAATAPFVAALMGIEPTGEDADRVKYLDPPQLREKVFGAAQALLEQMASVRPLVLVFEDLHWIDPTSLELLEQLISVTDRVAMTIICLFRPWRQEPSWRIHELANRDYAHRYNSLMLQPLNADQSRELVANLLHVEDLPEKVRALILKKSEGNPFFVEEVIRSLLDANLVVRQNSHWVTTREIESIAVPDTLAGVITARLDQLDDGTKRLAQTASVIGREFRYDELAAVHDARDGLDQVLTELQRRELVREKSRFPERVYIFKHAMTQETAYGSLLLSRRRELHKRVAESIEQNDPERDGDIARHYLEARDQTRALPFLVAAADRAARAYSTGVALKLYSQALEITNTVKDVPLARRAFEGKGSALTLSNDITGAVENYEAMLSIAVEHDDIPMRVSAKNKLGMVLGMRLGQFPEGLRQLEESEQLARRHEDSQGLAELHMIQCSFCVATADFERAVDYLSEAAEIGHKLDLEEPKLYGLTHVSNMQTFMARFDDAWATAQETRQIAEELGNRLYLSELMTFTMPLYHLRNGDLDLARQSAAEGMSIAAQIGAAGNECSGAYILGSLSALVGDYQQAISHYNRALDAAGRAGSPWNEAMTLCALGTAHLDISMEMLDKTVGFHERALVVMEQPGGKVTGAASWAELGFCAMAAGDLDGTAEYFENGLDTPTAMMNLARPQLLVGSAFLALARDEVDHAATHVEDAQDFVERHKMKHFYPLIAFAAGQASASAGDGQKAVEDFSRAEELAMRLQMRPLIFNARAGAATVLSRAGHAKEAVEKRNQAQAIIDEIAEMFTDEKLRVMYLENAAAKLG